MPEGRDRIPVVSIGRLERQEFAAARAQLRSEIASIHFEHATVEEFLRDTESTTTPWLIVLWQSYSEEFPVDALTSLMARHPLATITCLYGAWCGSDARTRPGWPAAARAPLEEGMARLRALRDVLLGLYPTLPLTASREEIWIWDVGILRS